MATINKIPKCPPLRFPDFNDDWRVTTLGEIGDIRMCKRIFADQTNTESGVPFYKIGTIGKTADCYISSSLFEEYTKRYPYPTKGQILITCAGTIGRCLIFDGVPSYFQDSNIVWIDNNQSVIANSFLFHILNNTNWSRLNTSTITRLYNDDLRNVLLTFPTLSEQKKIADFLSLIDERITNLSETIKELKTQKAGLLNQLFSQKLRFPDFNDEWRPFFVGDIAKLGRGRVISNKEIQIQLKPLYPVYSSQTLNNGVMGYLDTFDFEGEYITWTTDGANAGTVFYRSGKFNCTNVCGILKLKSEFSHLFCALGLQKETKKFVSTNLANPKLMNNTMAKISLSIPSLEEQKKIADFLSLIDERIEVEEQLLKKYEEQKKYLLRKMFV